MHNTGAAKLEPAPEAPRHDRNIVASQTCDAQSAPERTGYLSAVQDLIARAGGDGAGFAAARASLDSFREEVNGAYRTVVMRCKTHMQCLEVNGYDEARCYMAASDRKDAERQFAVLAYQLRDLEREVRIAEIDAAKAAARAKKPGPNVSVATTVTQNNEQRSGDVIEDQDVLAMCGVDGLLKKECRSKCGDKGCR